MKLHEPISEIANTYQAEKLVTLPELIDPDTTDELLGFIRERDFERISNSMALPEQNHIFWDQQRVADRDGLVGDDRIFNFFGQSAIKGLVEAATKQEITPDHHCWVNHYNAGEFMGPHKDGRGVGALLICLQTVEAPECGGSLIVEDQEPPSRIFLQPGDGILFKSDEYRHYTEPLQPSATNPEPERIIIAARYYAAT
jgi:hypothetical protein